MNDVALLIPVYGKPEVTGSCLDSLFRSISAEAGITTIVIDDGSDGATKSIIEQHPVQMLTNDRNRGYVYSINRGIEHALQETSAEYIALMNNDLVFEPGWLESLLEQVDIYDIVGFFGRTSVTHGGTCRSPTSSFPAPS